MPGDVGQPEFIRAHRIKHALHKAFVHGCADPFPASRARFCPYTTTAAVVAAGSPNMTPVRTTGTACHELISGMERGSKYSVDGVNFDGYDPTRNVLLDAKDWKNYPPLSQKFWKDGTVDGIRRQVAVADGMPIEGHFTTEAAKDTIDELILDARLMGQIDAILTPFS